MITIVARKFRDMGFIEFNCPECGEDLIFSTHMICESCMAAIPAVDTMLEEIDARFGFYVGQDPWDYS